MRQRFLLLALPAMLVLGATLLSYGRGAFPCKTGTGGKIPADVTRVINSCGQCHGPQGALAAKAHVDVPTYSLDAGQSMTLDTRATGGIMALGMEDWGGFLTEVTQGTLTAGPTSQVDAAGKFVTHTFAFNGGRSWRYGYTAPTTPGLVEVWAVINTVNGSGDPSGDFWGFVGPDRRDPNNVQVRLFVNAPGVRSVGEGCDGGHETHPVLGAATSPAVGNVAFVLDLVGAVTAAPVSLEVGLLLPVPFDLSAIGVAGCNLYVQSLTSLPGFTSAGNAKHGEGAATAPLPIPNVVALRGVRLWVQAALFDAASGRQLPFTLTNARDHDLVTARL